MCRAQARLACPRWRTGIELSGRCGRWSGLNKFLRCVAAARRRSVWLAQWLCARCGQRSSPSPQAAGLGFDQPAVSSLCKDARRHRGLVDEALRPAPATAPDPSTWGLQHLITQAGGDSGCGEWRGRLVAVRKKAVRQRGEARRNTAGSSPSSVLGSSWPALHRPTHLSEECRPIGFASVVDHHRMKPNSPSPLLATTRFRRRRQHGLFSPPPFPKGFGGGPAQSFSAQAK